MKHYRLHHFMRTRDNALNMVRLLLALGVAIAHALTIKSGVGAPESVRLFDLTTSYMAVNGFFLLSGMLIAWSLDFRQDLVFFTIARILRLFPALFVLGLIASLLIGPWLSTMSWSEYIHDRKFWSYPLRVITLGRVDDGPPGLFTNAPWPGEFSGSLWTLRYEAIAYVGAGVAYVLGVLKHRHGPAILALLSIAVFAAMGQYFGDSLNHTPIFALVRFSACFTIGMSAYQYAKYIPLRWIYLPVFLGLFLLFGHTSLKEIMANFALGYCILLLGFRTKSLFAYTQKIPDMSYGIYIWHWPIYQIFLLQNPDTSQWILVFLAIPLAGICALLSWNMVEKPALQMKQPVANWVKKQMGLWSKK